MHIHSLKLLTLLSTLSFVSVAFPSAPPVLPFAKAQDELRAKSEVETQQVADPFEAKLAVIDAMDELDILCEPLPLSRDAAEQCLVESKAFLAHSKQQVPKLFDASVPYRRLCHKYWTTCKEIEACDNNERKQQLINKKQEFHAQAQNADNVLVQEATTLLNEGGNSTIYVYNYRRYQAGAFANQLRLERIKNEEAEKREARLQQKEIQSQQEIQALKVQNRNLQAFIDGPQREGVPNVPGGPQPQEGIQRKKRSSSCEI